MGATFELLIMLSMSYMLFIVEGMTTSGWMKASATFYGGSDASGTMGIYIYMDIIPPILLHNFFS